MSLFSVKPPPIATSFTGYGVTLQAGQSADTSRLDKLGAGVCRVVYELGPDLVLKVASERSGYEANLRTNQHEAITYANSGKHHKALARIYAADPEGRWLVMERVDELGDNVYPIPPSHHDMNDAEIALGLKDIHGQNWGVKGEERRCLLIDYGFSNQFTPDDYESAGGDLSQCADSDCSVCSPQYDSQTYCSCCVELPDEGEEE